MFLCFLQLASSFALAADFNELDSGSDDEKTCSICTAAECIECSKLRCKGCIYGCGIFWQCYPTWEVIKRFWASTSCCCKICHACECPLVLTGDIIGCGICRPVGSLFCGVAGCCCPNETIDMNEQYQEFFEPKMPSLRN